MLTDGPAHCLGGSLDFFFTSGPTPLDVIREHYDVVGKPELYPAWSFGFHLCRSVRLLDIYPCACLAKTLTVGRWHMWHDRLQMGIR